jgi:hypothetical protein
VRLVFTISAPPPSHLSRPFPFTQLVVLARISPARNHEPCVEAFAAHAVAPFRDLHVILAEEALAEADGPEAVSAADAGGGRVEWLRGFPRVVAVTVDGGGLDAEVAVAGGALIDGGAQTQDVDDARWREVASTKAPYGKGLTSRAIVDTKRGG